MSSPPQIVHPVTSPAASDSVPDWSHGDARFLGLELAEPETFDGRTAHGRLTVVEHLARLDGRLYGGTAIAASIAGAELVTRRPVNWMTTQFVSTVERGTELSLTLEVLAPGRRTSQVRLTGASPTGEIVFASLGASGRHRTDGLTGVFEQRPDVTDPDDSERWDSPFSGMAAAAGLSGDLPAMPSNTGFTTAIELRHARIDGRRDLEPGRVCLWVRRRDSVAISPAVAAFVADMVPMSIARACGVMALGTSLDNTIRIGAATPTEWVLVDLRPHFVAGDYGHGVAHVWNEDGQLLATASQTAAMRAVDLDALPWANHRLTDHPSGGDPS